jgi:hypothetical protein
MEPLHHADNSFVQQQNHHQSTPPFSANQDADDDDDASSVVSPTGNGGTLSPPYWQSSELVDGSGRARAASDSSLRSPPIQMLDNTQEDSEQFRACWARSAKIDGWVVVGMARGLGRVGSYVVFNCLVETANVSLSMQPYKGACCGKKHFGYGMRSIAFTISFCATQT